MPVSSSTRSSRLLSTALVGLSLFLGLAATASATLFVRVADADLADGADLVAIAEIHGTDPTAGIDRPRTAYDVEIVEAITGSAAFLDGEVRQVSLLVPGGEIDGRTLRVDGAPSFAPGERALLFLKQRADGSWAARHVFQGVFRIARHEGRDVAFRSFEGATELPLAGRRHLDSEAPRDLERFVDWLRDRATGDPRPADYFLDDVSVSDLAAPANKFTFLSNGGFGLRWREFDTGASVPFRSHSGGQPGLPGGGHAEFQQALQVWNADPATPINLRYAGQTNASAGLTSFDGVNAILFDDPNGEFDEPFDCNVGGVLAIGGPWFDPSNRHMFAGETYITILGGDIVTNKGLACWIGTLRRAAETFAHEVGHAIGLGHSCGDGGSGPCNDFPKDDALMRAFVHGDNRGARLGSDDRAAIAFLYGNASLPPDAPSGLSATVESLDAVRLSWGDNSTNESAFDIERRVGGGSFASLAVVGANVRSFTDTNAPSGSSVAYRVRARNGAGASGYSNNATVQTAGEPPPSGLEALALDATRVRLLWNDNADEETGFEIEADGFGVFVPIATTPANTTALVIDDLNPNIEYTFRIRSTGGPSGRSTFSAPATATTLDGVPNPCVADDERLCLNRDRFRVQVFFRDEAGDVGVASTAEAGTPDSGLLWFFDENNLEVLVKVLDACGLNQNFWVLSAATTNLEYTLVVTDTETGETAVYTNQAGEPAPAVIDVGALPVCPGAGTATTPAAPSSAVRQRTSEAIDAASRELSEILGSKSADGPTERATATDKAPGVGCPDELDVLCLNDERFQVEVDFTSAETSGRGQAVPVAADSGLFWFFDANNWEMLVKVLDACGVNQRYWVFSAATTDVAYTLRVTDTQTGEVSEYVNTLGDLAPAVVDIDAFDACP